ncbi:MAG: hypothetical protein ABJO36_01770 [Litorimonas sp.]
MLLFVFVGSLWSLSRSYTETLSIIEHLHNGRVFSTWMNILALLGGTSIGLFALFELSKDTKSNLVIAGFVVTHFTIVITNFWIGDYEFKRDPRPDTVIDKIIDLRENLKKKE